MSPKIPYRWKLRDSPSNVDIQHLAQIFKFPTTLIKILVNRGYDTEEKIKRFITNDIIYIQNPFLFPDMANAVEIIKRHIEGKNNILIWGDRDVDGITSVCLLVKTLKILGANVEWYIPQSEGYGLHLDVLKKYIDKVKLVITVDCGITAYEEVKYLKDNEIDVVITDHHEPDILTKDKFVELNVPVINPYLPEYTGFKDLAGVGVAFKLVTALVMSYIKNYYNKDFVVLDIETTGLSCYADEICEIAAVKIRNFLPQETFHTLVKPHNTIPQEVVRIHGITNEMVKDAPTIDNIIPQLFEFIKGTTLVVHNADFDLSFINLQLKKLGYPTIDISQVIDTLKLSREYYPVGSHSLSALSEDFIFKNQPSHRAMDDVLATIELFYYLYFISNPRLRLFIENCLPYVCLGTISDLVPLIEDNRIIVKKGIENMVSSKEVCFKIIIDYLKQMINSSNFTSEDISWYIIPLLNSAGRMQEVSLAINFLLAEDKTEAEDYFRKLIEINNRRKALQNTNLSVFYSLVEQQCNLKEDIILLVVAENVEHGVTGVIANNMLREFNRPVILLITDNGTATGTARSPKGTNIYELLKKCEHLFEKFGGHENACGLTINKDKIPEFRKQLKVVEKELVITPPVLEIDTEIIPEEINFELYRSFDLLEPCGYENPYPIFLIKNLKIVDWKYIGRENSAATITFAPLRNEQKTVINSICWDMDQADLTNILKNFMVFNIVGEIELDPQKKNELRVVLLDLQPVT
ncbi:MAG: single-stranded-DNA-specific exonuclease RecJ [Elusimicrobiota bacterium]|nr:single-stranded-DNA-specific exonuclease RecJ [Elusimicrobiota bacterium]